MTAYVMCFVNLLVGLCLQQGGACQAYVLRPQFCRVDSLLSSGRRQANSGCELKSEHVWPESQCKSQPSVDRLASPPTGHGEFHDCAPAIESASHGVIVQSILVRPSGTLDELTTKRVRPPVAWDPGISGGEPKPPLQKAKTTWPREKQKIISVGDCARRDQEASIQEAIDSALRLHREVVRMQGGREDAAASPTVCFKAMGVLKWLVDTGCGYNLIAKDAVAEAAPDLDEVLSRTYDAVRLNTAGGPVQTDETVGVSCPEFD